MIFLTKINLKDLLYKKKIFIFTMTSMSEMTTDEMNKHIKFFKRLKQIRKCDRKNFFSQCSDADIQLMCESCKNIYHDTLNMGEKKKAQVKKKLLPFKKEFIKLCNSQTPNKVRRSLLKNKQVGSGIFTILASTVLPILLSSIIKKFKK